MERRQFLAGSALAAFVATRQEPAAPAARPPKRRLKQSVSRWCYGSMPLDDLCREAKAIGIGSVELLDEKDWDVPIRHGLTCAMPNGPGGPRAIEVGWNRPENHDELVKRAEHLLPGIAERKFPNMILLSGNRAKTSDADGIRNCVTGIRRIAPLAEELGVTLCLEVLNSRVDHPDYHFDKVDWGVEVVKGVGSPRLKILFDVYHVQIMEGDVIRRIRESKAWIGHYHTGGVPGRHEIDEGQELNYRAICKAIVETGFDGWLSHEFVPTRDPMKSLRQAFEICDV